jgi:hypothetical protein
LAWEFGHQKDFHAHLPVLLRYHHTTSWNNLQDIEGSTLLASTSLVIHLPFEVLGQSAKCI